MNGGKKNKSIPSQTNFQLSYPVDVGDSEVLGRGSDEAVDDAGNDDANAGIPRKGVGEAIDNGMLWCGVASVQNDL